ncbi:hypothetical protein [Sinomonas sp. P10A9]|uniref:LPXTG-motif cell wall-anchored protein n=1 Tax=Sinomonas puerhi TaxID=3238584 RepID=A0AB39L5C6_9MICC
MTTPPATTPPATTPPATTQPPASTTSPAVVPEGTTSAPPAQGQGGAQNPAPAESVAISAQTSASPTAADYTVPGLLFGSGSLLGAWLALTLWMKRRRGEHV